MKEGRKEGREEGKKELREGEKMEVGGREDGRKERGNERIVI